MTNQNYIKIQDATLPSLFWSISDLWKKVEVIITNNMNDNDL